MKKHGLLSRWVALKMAFSDVVCGTPADANEKQKRKQVLSAKLFELMCEIEEDIEKEERKDAHRP